MRRALSILLVLLFGLGPLAVTLDAGDDSRLPACCRRHGAHHCAMADSTDARMAQAASNSPVLAAPSHCHFYPGDTIAIMAPVHALAPSPASVPALHSQAHSPISYQAAASSLQFRSHTGRSPPTPILG